MQLRKISETKDTITLGWQPVACEGYLFYADGKRVSKSFDPTRSQVRFSKGAKSYRVEAVTFNVVDGDSWPDAPASYVKVAPKVCNKVPGGSDPRFCMFNPDGSLRPGVTRLPNGQYTDESGAKYAADGDGLEESSIRSTDFVPGVVFANDTNGVPYCQLPMVGDPTKNTGSWMV